MSKPGKKEQANLPPVRIQTVESRMWCVMEATEAGLAITAGAARRTLGKRKGRRCML
jgi:hypothetical protein